MQHKLASEKEIKKNNKETSTKTTKTNSHYSTTKTKQEISSKPKSARGRKKTPQEIREEMLKELENSKLK